MSKWKLLFILGVGGILILVPWMGAESLQVRDLFSPGTLTYKIFWELRFPRLLTTFALGGILAGVGGVYQSLFKNPLCDPYILGVSSAVLLGVAVGETFFQQSQGTLGSFVWGMGGALILVCVLMFFSSGKLGTSERIVLFGMGANFFLSSLLFVVLSLKSQSIGGGTLKWFFGFLPWTTLRESLGFLILGLLSLGFLTLFSKALDVLRLGDAVAKTLSVHPVFTRNAYLLATSVLIGITVSISGTIGFVGLVVPQICKLIFKPQSMISQIPLSFFVGACFLSLADALSRSLIPPFEFPVGIMTTLLGGPIFLLVLWRKSL